MCLEQTLKKITSKITPGNIYPIKIDMLVKITLYPVGKGGSHISLTWTHSGKCTCLLSLTKTKCSIGLVYNRIV